MKTTHGWIARLMIFVAIVVGVLVGGAAWARVGGGEHFDSGRRDSSDDSGGVGFIFQLLIELLIRNPCIGIPVVLIAIGIYIYVKRQEGSATTRKALDVAAAQSRTTVAARDVERWVSALKAQDPHFDLMAFFDRTRKLFLEVQEAWFLRSLEPVRRYLSDATWARLAIQLKLLYAQGVRDAIADVQVLDLQIIGLDQTPFFDSVHVRVKAQLRDDDAPKSATDEQARQLAKQKAPEAFFEVWSFVRKPGAVTHEKQGACPNCGAPFAGGASNQCEFCKAIVNSGHYDWVLAEITQGSEYGPASQTQSIKGLHEAQQRDPQLNTEVLEDRASLCFWKWVDAQASGDAGRLAKIADPEFTARLKTDLDELAAQGRRKLFLECAVGAVNTLALTSDHDRDLAHLEIRWSARTGLVPLGQQVSNLPSVPQRSVFTLHRKSGAITPPATGLSTARCPNCAAPLSDNALVSCDFCGTMLATGERDWVIREISSWEAWGASTRAPVPNMSARRVDQEERQRLLYLMAAIAVSDGVVDAQEKKLLKRCSERWRVPYANVELALSAGPGLFERLIVKGSSEAEVFLRELVNMALIDGRVDRHERALLQRAAQHVGLAGQLDALIASSSDDSMNR